MIEDFVTDPGKLTVVGLLVAFVILFLRNTIMLTSIHKELMDRQRTECAERIQKLEQDVKFWQNMSMEYWRSADRVIRTEAQRLGIGHSDKS